MAKQAKQNGSTEVQEEKKEERKQVTKEQYLKLFAAYDAANKVYAEAASALERAKNTRSEAVKAFYDAFGKKGPFTHPKSNINYSVVERKNPETKDSTWFFKGPGEADVIDLNSLG